MLWGFFPYALEYKIYSLKLYHIKHLHIKSKASAYMLDLLRSPIRPTIPYDALVRISQGIFSIYYLLSGSNGLFLSLTFVTAAFITNLINFYKIVLRLNFVGKLI